MIETTKEDLIELYQLGESCEGWYETARERIGQFAESVGYSAEYIAGIVSVLSPRVHVTRNCKLAESYVNDGSLEGVVKASRAAMEHYETTREIRGPKTGPFADAINPDCEHADDSVVVDTWIWRIFFPNQDFGKANKTTRSAIIETIRDMAAEIGETPANFQARLWGGVRVKYGLKSEGQNLEFSGVEL
jgi:hypothetical protein